MLSTTLVWLLKREKLSSSSEPEDDLSIAQTYKLLLKIFRLPTIQLTVVILMTARVSFRQFPPSRPLINQFQFGSFGCRSGSQPTPSPLSNWSKRWISSIHRSSVAFHLIALTEFSGRSQSAIGPAAGASGPSSNHPAVDDQSIYNRTSTHGSLSESYSVQVSIDCVQILADPNRYSQIRKPNCKDFRPVLINPIIRDPYRSLLILRGTQRWGSFLGFFFFCDSFRVSDLKDSAYIIRIDGQGSSSSSWQSRGLFSNVMPTNAGSFRGSNCSQKIPNKIS